MTRLFAMAACLCASAANAADEAGVPCAGLMLDAGKLIATEMLRGSERKAAGTAHEMASQMLDNCEARNSPPQPGTDACAEERASARATAEVLASVRAEDTKRRAALAITLQGRMEGCRIEP